jgi:hypothetical protein
MSDEPRRIFVGVLPSGVDATFIDGVDPLVAMIDDATARLDRMREEDERARLAQIADIERMRNTRRARAARRFKSALRMFARMR